MIAADRQAGLARDAAGAENRVKGGEAGGHDGADRVDPRRSFDRQRSFDHLRYRRQCSDDRTVPTRRLHSEPARSCRTPAIPEGRQGGRDIGGNSGHDADYRTSVLLVKASGRARAPGRAPHTAPPRRHGTVKKPG